MAGKFVIKTAKDGSPFFVLKAGNGEPILKSEMYSSMDACENGIESVKKNSQDEGKFDVLEAKDGSPYFVLKAGNGQVIGNSEMYSSSSACKNGIESVMKNAAEADVVTE